MDNSKIIDGKKISCEIKNELKKKVKLLRNDSIIPGLAVILIGNDSASKVYVKNKKRACDEIGIYSEEYFFNENISQFEIIQLINKLNLDQKIHGILVQLPLPPHINSDLIAKSISPKKDVDMLNPENVGKIMLGNYDKKIDMLPCTPCGIIELLNRENVEIYGKHAVVIGRSKIVGKPLAMLLLNDNATVTICHTKTQNLEKICQTADILISACGKINLITEDMVKEGAVVIDVGISRTLDGKIHGDVDFNNVIKKAAKITPVPGGVGPMTIAMLMKNCIKAATSKK